jgi:hypothetical protein
MWAQAVSGWWCIGLGEKRVGLQVELVAGPNWCPVACFHIFCSDSFSFSFSVFFFLFYFLISISSI